MNFFCKQGIHKWEHCKCVRCGLTVDEDHLWDGCVCTICGKTRDEQHEWNGCICKKCGKKRDYKHQWDGCLCTVCKTNRDREHQLEFILDSCRKRGYGDKLLDEFLPYHAYRCIKCGRTIQERHKWINEGCLTECSVCGCKASSLAESDHDKTIDDTWNKKTIDISHQWIYKGCRGTCQRCGKVNPYDKHKWIEDGENKYCRVCGNSYKAIMWSAKPWWMELESPEE